jgi:hypothetical protein
MRSNQAKPAAAAAIAEPAVSAPAPEPMPAAAEVAPAADRSRGVLLEIPICPSGGHARRLLPELSGPEARMLRNVAEGLIADGRLLDNGRPVKDSRDALSWILQQLARNTPVS